MLEIEIKYRLDAPERVKTFFAARWISHRLVRQDIDYYLNAPDRDFASTDEALRLRRIGSQNFLTYKGPRKDATTKTRAEIEIEMPEGNETAEGLLSLFKALGYRFVHVVKKQRTIYEYSYDGYNVQFCWDEVEGLGNYIELEIMAEQSEYERAKEALFDLAEKIGLTQQENRSYLEMLLGHAVTPGGDK